MKFLTALMGITASVKQKQKEFSWGPEGGPQGDIVSLLRCS